MSFHDLREYLCSTCRPDGRPLIVVEKVDRCDMKSVRAAVDHILTASSADRILKKWRQQRIILKPNFCRVGWLGETTSVEAIETVLGILKDYSCKVIFGDGMTQAYLPPRNPEGFNKVAAQLSYVVKKYGIPFVHFDEPRQKRTPVEADGHVFHLPSWIKDVYGLVNLAVLKLHPQMVGSFAIKNHMGLLSGPDRLDLHRTGIAEGIWRLQACLGKVVPQQIHLIDGLFSFQGYDAPHEYMKPAIFVGGLNPCAIDFACAQVMSIDPKLQFPQYTVALKNGFAYGHDKPVNWLGPPLNEIRFQCHIPNQIVEPPPSLSNVRIIWGSFGYPMNQAVKDLLSAMDRDLPIDIYVGGASPKTDAEGRWSICLGNASIATYKGNCERIITIPGNPPARTEFQQILQDVAI